METDDDNRSIGRRISRRSRTGFAFSSASVSDSTEGGGVRGINDSVEAMVENPVASLPPRTGFMPLNAPRTSEPPIVAGNPSEEFNPQARMAQVRSRAGQYEKEYRLGLLHRLLMRRIPIDEIADQLAISVSQCYRDREELATRLRAEARSLDIDELVGDSKGFYEEAAAMSMRAASNANLPMPMRLAAIRTALASKNDMHRFFQTAGVYDVLRFRLAQDGSGVSDVRRLMDNTDRLLRGEALEFSNAAKEVVDSGSHESMEL